MYELIEGSNFDNRSMFYLVRSLISSVNAQLIGIASNALRAEDKILNDDDPRKATIDKFNEYFAAKGENNTAPVGLEERMPPAELASLLRAVRAKWMDLGHEYPDDLLEADINQTLQFMISRPMRDLNQSMVEQVAKATGLSAMDIVKAQETSFHEDRKFLRENQDRILAWIESQDYGDPEEAYDLLPARYQVRILSKFESYIDKQRLRAVQAVVSKGIANAMGELVILNATKAAITSWKDTRAKRDPQFAEALLVA
jgi:hypothetical protein